MNSAFADGLSHHLSSHYAPPHAFPQQPHQQHPPHPQQSQPWQQQQHQRSHSHADPYIHSPHQHSQVESSKPAKRKRVSLACSSCKARKIRCERVYPCESCIKRGDADSCRPEQPIDSRGLSLVDSLPPSSSSAVAEERSEPPPPQPQQPPGHVTPSSNNNNNNSNGGELAALRDRVHNLEQALLLKIPDVAPLLHAAPSPQPGHMLPPLSSISKRSSPSTQPVPAYSHGTNAAASPAQSQASAQKSSQPAADEESEDAAQVLEDLALGITPGRKQGAATGAGATAAERTSSSVAATPSSANSPFHPQRLFPSIATNPPHSDLNRTVLDVLLARLPSDADLLASIDIYFTEISWTWAIVCQPQLRAELDEFLRLRARGLAHTVDPAWLALLFVVLALTLSAQHDIAHWESAAEAGFEARTQQFYDSARFCLDMSNFCSTPQMRSLTTVLLFINYLTILPVQVPDYGGLKRKARVMPLIACAIRMGQYLDLDGLSSSPEAMPLLPDPAFPERPSLLARQMGCRVWAMLVFLECMRCSKDGESTSMIPKHLQTAPVGNYNDSDLGFDLHTPQRPQSELTDSTTELLKLRTSKVALLVEELKANSNVSYERIGQADQEIRMLLSYRMYSNNLTENLRLRVIESGVHHRIMRLHRPWMVKGLKNPKYRASYELAIDSATQVASNLSLFVKSSSVMSRFWWLAVHVFGAALTLATGLLSQLEKPPSNPTIMSFRSHLEMTATCLDDVKAKASNASVRWITSYVLGMTRRLIEVDEEKRGPSGREGISVSTAFADIASSLQPLNSGGGESGGRAYSDSHVETSSGSSKPTPETPADNSYDSTHDWLANLEYLAPLPDNELVSEIDPGVSMLNYSMFDNPELGNLSAWFSNTNTAKR